MPPLLTHLLGAVAAAPSLWQRRSPVKNWRVMIVDPDGVPGELFLLDVEQVSRLVTLLRHQTDARRD